MTEYKFLRDLVLLIFYYIFSDNVNAPRNFKHNQNSTFIVNEPRNSKLVEQLVVMNEPRNTDSVEHLDVVNEPRNIKHLEHNLMR